MRLHHSDVGEEAVVGGVEHRNAGHGAGIDNVLSLNFLAATSTKRFLSPKKIRPMIRHMSLMKFG